MGSSVLDYNLFMMCDTLNRAALIPIPRGYYVRTLRPEELSFWMDMQFDNPAAAREYRPFMDAFFRDTYAPHGDLFFRTCLLLCRQDGTPVGTCFAWRAYGVLTTIHWFKVLKHHEGMGLGRALLSYVMEGIAAQDYPVYLHTQPGSYRAIGLYVDFGFALLTDAEIGYRKNQLNESMDTLRSLMRPDAFAALRFEQAPLPLLEACLSSRKDEF